MKRIAKLVVMTSLLMSLIGVASAKAADVLFINNSGVYLRFFIDGHSAGACPSGDQQVASTNVGVHTLVALDPKTGMTVTRPGAYVGNGGLRYTITPPP